MRAENSEFEHGWQAPCLKSFNTERKSMKSCIMHFAFYQSLLHFRQDKQSPTLFQGQTAKAVPCAVILKDAAAAASIHACSTSSISAKEEMLQCKSVTMPPNSDTGLGQCHVNGSNKNQTCLNRKKKPALKFAKPRCIMAFTVWVWNSWSVDESFQIHSYWVP